MLTLSKRPTLNWQTLLNRVEKPLTALVLTVGLTLVAVGQSHARTVTPDLGSTEVATANPGLTVSQRMADGVYLFGQSPEAFQNGSEYIVFEVNQDQVVGAFYLPNSSFDCFTGEVGTRQLSLNIVDSYDQTVHPYAVAMRAEGSVASTSDEAAPMTLEGFHQIANLSDLDQHILDTCRADL
ncbi:MULTISPECIES: hypothetical protein [unclassified Leptolyngbya]|uniref:hypothetical protein n=1 Tax=unclassified Leptolyngbya TaxID=2650499 RepID=UPI0016883CC6|nr:MULTISPECIES: hypothetical protein [unclassified Leptolyngbya]MBD1910692.1 hypothetical protein [Leptolyngbya sp. FACHB-8]MBD2154289.1 hypothetical protein [Leptolyngbya sp. FACHB-16]